MLSFLWGVVHCHALEKGENDIVQLSADAGRLALLCNPLLSATVSLRLSSVWEWTRYLQGWRQPHKQHDVAEFAMHVLRQLRPQCMEGSWQSRSSLGEVRDVGDTNVPLYIVTPSGGKVGIQACVQQWSVQDFTHALVNPPVLLCLQLERFVRRNRAIRKKPVPIVAGNIYMPLFVAASNRTEQIEYRLISMIVHHGNSPNVGHYRSVLRAPAEDGNPGRYQAFYTDDGISAIAIDNMDSFEKDVYLLWYLKATV